MVSLSFISKACLLVTLVHIEDWDKFSSTASTLVPRVLLFLTETYGWNRTFFRMKTLFGALRTQ